MGKKPVFKSVSHFNFIYFAFMHSFFSFNSLLNVVIILTSPQRRFKNVEDKFNGWWEKTVLKKHGENGKNGQKVLKEVEKP